MSLPPIDWRTVFMLLPRRRFSAVELARARPVTPGTTLVVSVAVNLAVPLAVFLAVFGPRNPWPYTAVLLCFAGGLLLAGAAAWRDPSGRVARGAYWALPLAAGLATGLMARDPGYERASVVALAMLELIGILGLWFALVHRHQYIEMRLAELDEREKSIEMARRLAAAQIEPHFLFNTLASLQHWVATRDERATGLLTALTGYLRATLPMFARPRIAAGDELLAVERYLQVMQARLGSRLVWRIEVEAAARAVPLPPGLLLTLVENAVAHGIEPQREGGQVHIDGARDGDEAVFEVRDDGPGPAQDMHDGVGLANARQRLALTAGPGARLEIGAAPGGGCRATLRLPWSTT